MDVKACRYRASELPLAHNVSGAALISVSDILKILEQIPVWKALVSLPKRLGELEGRMKALEDGRAGAPNRAPGPKECPKCGATMRVEREEAHRTFSSAGVKNHFLTCDACGNEAERMYSPGKGYV
jgi:hypothetical protein